MSMHIDSKNMVTMTEASQDFSRVARMADDGSVVVILKNNEPRYVLMDYARAEGQVADDDDALMELSKKLIEENRAAYEELAR